MTDEREIPTRVSSHDAATGERVLAGGVYFLVCRELRESRALSWWMVSRPPWLGAPLFGTNEAQLARVHAHGLVRVVVVEDEEAIIDPLDVGKELASRYFAVEVCDDHDGGSVWYPEEDYMDRDDAVALAEELSRSRENRVARVLEVHTVVVRQYVNGEVTT